MSACKITFTGDFSQFESNLKSKISDVKVTKIAEGVVLAKCENLEDIHYFKNFSLQDDIKILEIIDVVEEDYKTQIGEMFPTESDIQKSIIINEGGEIDPTANLNKALLNTTLNSKNLLQEQDSAKFVFSKTYLTYTSFAVSLVIFIGSLF